MARTNKGSKGAGFDYWSKRPFNRGGGDWSRNGNSFAKRRVAKAERREGKAQTRQEE